MYEQKAAGVGPADRGLRGNMGRWTQGVQLRTEACKLAPLNTIARGPAPAFMRRGVTGLRVSDASAMPELISGKTHAWSIQIGTCCTEIALNLPAPQTGRARPPKNRVVEPAL